MGSEPQGEAPAVPEGGWDEEVKRLLHAHTMAEREFKEAKKVGDLAYKKLNAAANALNAALAGRDKARQKEA